MGSTTTKVTLVGETNQFVANMVKANKAILQMGKKLSGLTARFSKISKEFEDASQRISKVGGSFDKTGNSVKKAGKKAASASKNFKKLGTSLRHVGTDLRMVASSAGRYGAAMLAASGASALFAARFDQNMSRVTAISTGTTRGVGRDFDLLSKKALEAASRTEHTADQIVEGMKFMAMAGFKPDAIVGAIDTMAMVATAGGISMAQSGNIVTNVMAGYGITLANVEKQLRAENAEQGIFNQQMITGAAVASRFRGEMESTANMLIGTFTNANVDLMQMGEAFKLAGSNAKLLDMPKEDLFAMIGLLGNVGIQGTEAGTALKRSFFAMMKTTEKSRAAMKSFGIKKEDLQGEFGQLKVLQKLSGAMDAFTSKGKKLEFLTGLVEIFGERAGPKIAAALAQGTEEFIRLRDNIQESDWSGFGAKLETQLLDTALGKLNILKSSFQNFAIVMGNALLPTVIKLSKYFTKMFKGLAKNKDQLGVIAKAVSAIGVALVSLMALGIGGWIASWVGTGIANIGLLRGAINKAKDAFLAFEAVKKASNVGTGLSATFSTAAQTASSAASARGSNVPTLIGTGGGIKAVVKKIGGALKNVGGMFLRIGGLATTIFGGFMGTVTAVGAGFATLLVGAGALVGGFTGLLATFGTMENATNKLKGVFDGVGLTENQKKIEEEIGSGNEVKDTKLDKIVGRSEVLDPLTGEITRAATGLQKFIHVLGKEGTSVVAIYAPYIRQIKDTKGATAALSKMLKVFSKESGQSAENMATREKLANETTDEQIALMQKEIQERRKGLTLIKSQAADTAQTIRQFAKTTASKLEDMLQYTEVSRIKELPFGESGPAQMVTSRERTGDSSGEGFNAIVQDLFALGVEAERLKEIYSSKISREEKLALMTEELGRVMQEAATTLGVDMDSAIEASIDAQMSLVKASEEQVDALAKYKSHLETIAKLDKKRANAAFRRQMSSIRDMLNNKEFDKFIYLQKRSSAEFSSSIDGLKIFGIEMMQLSAAISKFKKSLSDEEKEQVAFIGNTAATQAADKAAEDYAEAIANGTMTWKEAQDDYVKMVGKITGRFKELFPNVKLASVGLDDGMVTEKLSPKLDSELDRLTEALKPLSEELGNARLKKGVAHLGKFSDLALEFKQSMKEYNKAVADLKEISSKREEVQGKIEGMRPGKKEKDGPRAAKELEDLKEKLKTLTTGVKDAEDAVSDLEPDANKAADGFMDIARASGVTKEEMEKLNKEMKGFELPEEDVIDPNARFPDTVGDIEGPWGGTDSAGNPSDKIKDAGFNQDISDWIQDAFGEMGADKGTGDAIGNEITDMVGGIQLPTGIGATIGTSIGTVVGAAFTKFGGAVWGPVLGGIVGSLGEELIKEIPGFVKKSINMMTGYIGKAFKLIGSKLQQIGKFIFDSAKKLGENVKSGVMALGDYFPEERAGSAFKTTTEQLTPGGGVFNVGASIAAALAVVAVAALAFVPVLAAMTAAMALLAALTIHFLPELMLLAVITGVLTGILIVFTTIIGTVVAIFLFLGTIVNIVAAVIFDMVVKILTLMSLFAAAINPFTYVMLGAVVWTVIAAMVALGVVIAAGIPAVIAVGIALIFASIAAALTGGLAGVLTFFTALAFKDVEGPYVDEEGNVQEEFKPKRKDVKAAFSGALDPLIIALDSLWAGVMPLAGLFSSLVSVMLPLAQGFSNTEGISRKVFYALKNLAIVFATSMLAVGYFATGVLEVVAWLLENVPTQVNTFMDEFGKALLGGLAWILRGLAEFAHVLGLPEAAIITVADELDEFSIGSAGDTLQDLADAARAMKPDLNAMALAIQELMNLTYEEALAIAEEIAARKNMDLAGFGESLTNVPEGFRVNLARYLSMNDEDPGMAVAGVSRPKLADMDPTDYFNRLGSEWSGVYGSGDPALSQLKDEIERLTEVMDPSEWAGAFGDVINGAFERTLEGFDEAFSRAADLVSSAILGPDEAFEFGDNSASGGIGNNFSEGKSGSVTNVYINDMNINDISSPADFGQEVARRVERDSMQQLGTPFSSGMRRGGEWGGGE